MRKHQGNRPFLTWFLSPRTIAFIVNCCLFFIAFCGFLMCTSQSLSYWRLYPCKITLFSLKIFNFLLSKIAKVYMILGRAVYGRPSKIALALSFMVLMDLSMIGTCLPCARICKLAGNRSWRYSLLSNSLSEKTSVM